MLLRPLLVPIAVLSLTACATIGSGGNIQNIQNATVLACSFLPTAETIAAILAANNPQLQTSAAIARAICAAVAPAPAATTSARAFVRLAPSVAGVRVVGQHV